MAKGFVDLLALIEDFQKGEKFQMYRAWQLMEVIASETSPELRDHIEKYLTMTPIDRCKQFLYEYLENVRRTGTTDGSKPERIVYNNIKFGLEEKIQLSQEVIKIWERALEDFKRYYHVGQ